MKNTTITMIMAATILIAGCGKKSPSSSATPPPAQADAASSAYPGDWIWEGNSRTLDRVPPIFLLRPSTLPANHVSSDIFGKDRYSARGKTLKELITVVWSQKNSALKIKFDADLPEGKFDFIVADQPHWPDKLQSEIDQRFHLVEKVETGETGDKVVVRNSDTP
jgi:predicted small lipoprotein YifL